MYPILEYRSPCAWLYLYRDDAHVSNGSSSITISFSLREKGNAGACTAPEGKNETELKISEVSFHVGKELLASGWLVS